MKHFSMIAFALTFCFSTPLCARDARAALQRYWKSYCFTENSVLQCITGDYIQFGGSGAPTPRKNLEILVVNTNRLFDAAKKNDFTATYNAFTAIMKVSAPGKNIKTHPASKISAKDREQFMTMMKRLAENQPSKNSLQKYKSFKIISERTTGDTTVFKISYTDFNRLCRSQITVVKQHERCLVSEDRQLPQKK